MAGIAGMMQARRINEVMDMLTKIAHRGIARNRVTEYSGATLGAVWPAVQDGAFNEEEKSVKDSAPDGRLAVAQVVNDRLLLVRGLFGVAPLYYGRTDGGTLCFASEVKALMQVTWDVHLLPAGHSFDGETVSRHFRPVSDPMLTDSIPETAFGLKCRLQDAVRKCIRHPKMGAWLSGGLDSSAMVALARPHLDEMHTFAVGLQDAPDLEYARDVAAHCECRHHELVVGVDDLLKALPTVIYYLESFDALLVRSSITNYMVARMAAQYVEEVFSGEGGDELFAGYAYLKGIALDQLAGELIDITGRLHNTALQRVDRSAGANGLVAYVPFLTPDVAEYALRIPPSLKIRSGVEKWILREALDGLLPERVLSRPKVKFWEGAGVSERLADCASKQVTDADFAKERTLPNGWQINTKEELMYYRIFKEHFGNCRSLDWMGRTKAVERA